MANIKFKYIKLHHFMSYDDTEFSLDRSGYIFISGVNNNDIDNAKSNGAGKSTLFSALCWCLTGETPSGNKKVENIYLGGETSVEVGFDINNDEYILKRTKNPSNLFITINNENKSGKGIRDTEKLLAEYLPDITSSLINSVIILGQGLPKRFTNNTPSGRKEILEQLSNSDFMISDIKERLKRRVDKLEEDKLSCNNSIIKNRTKVSILENEIKKDTEKLEAIDVANLELQLDRINSDKVRIQHDLDSFTAAKEEVEAQKNTNLARLEQFSIEYTEEFNKLDLVKQDDLDDLVSEIASLKATLSMKKNEIAKLESITDVCPTCGQKIPGVTKLDTSELKEECDVINHNISDCSQKLEEFKRHNSELIDNLDNKHDEKRKALNEIISTLESDANNYSNILSSKTVEYQTLSNECVRIEVEINNINSTIKDLEDNIARNKVDLAMLNGAITTDSIIIIDIDTRLDILNKINSLIKRDFRGYLLSNIIEFISTKCKLYSKEVFGSDNFAFELDGNNIVISYDNKEYESLSGGEKQKADVIIQLAIRDMLCNYLNFSSNILVLDEITDSLDVVGSQNVLNLISKELADVEAIYIISHHTDFAIPWDEEITIAKDNNKISRIL